MKEQTRERVLDAMSALRALGVNQPTTNEVLARVRLVDNRFGHTNVLSVLGGLARRRVVREVESPRGQRRWELR